MNDLQPLDIDEAPALGGAVPAGTTLVRSLDANMGAVRVSAPRRLAAVLAEIRESAAVFGDKWEYELPFAGQDGKRAVRGATVKCAEEVARAFGNCNVECRVTGETADAYLLEGVFTDIERGYRLVRPFRQRKAMITGTFRGDRARQDDNIFLIGASKATRNVVVNALSGLIEQALEAARENLAQKIGRNLEEWRTKVGARLEDLGIDGPRFTARIGQSLKDADARRMAMAIRILQGISDGLTSAEDAFPQVIVPAVAQPEAVAPVKQAKPAPAKPPKVEHVPLRAQKPEPADEPEPEATVADEGSPPPRPVLRAGRGRPSNEARARYEAELAEWERKWGEPKAEPEPSAEATPQAAVGSRISRAEAEAPKHKGPVLELPLVNWDGEELMVETSAWTAQAKALIAGATSDGDLTWWTEQNPKAMGYGSIREAVAARRKELEQEIAAAGDDEGA